jgi:DNA-directed RNA polymerase specialized sigma24 family protein
MNLNEAYALYVTNPEENKELFGNELLKFCRKFTRNLSKDPAGVTSESSWCSTQDASSDAVITILKKMDTFDVARGVSFTTWAGKIVIDAVKDSNRRYGKRQEIGLYDVTLSHEPHRAIEDKLTLKKMISTLNEADKYFVKLKMDGYDQGQIGKAFERDALWAKEKWKYLKKKFTQMAS